MLVQVVPDVEALGVLIEGLDIVSLLFLVVILMVFIILGLIATMIWQLRTGKQITRDDSDLMKSSFELIKALQTDFSTATKNFGDAVDIFKQVLEKGENDKKQFQQWIIEHEKSADTRAHRMTKVILDGVSLMLTQTEEEQEEIEHETV